MSQENQVITDKGLTFKVQDIAFNANYEFIVACPKGGWTMKQASQKAYNLMQIICTGCMVDVYLGEDLIASNNGNN